MSAPEPAATALAPSGKRATYCYQCVAGPDPLTVQVVDGVATEVVRPEALDSAVEGVLQRLRPLPGPCLRRMKALVNRCADVPLQEALDLEFAEFADYHATEPTSADGFHSWWTSRHG